MATMRQAVLAAPGVVEVQDGPLPEPGAGELRVRAEAFALAGGDGAVKGPPPPAGGCVASP